jgi:outer membrane protein, multidrug efflux system
VNFLVSIRRRGSLIGASALLPVLVSGCLGLRPAVPKEANLQVPEHWRTPGQRAGSIESDWWRAFGDPRLTQLVERALAHNDDLAGAAQRVEEARALARLARAQQLPLSTFSLEGGRSRILVISDGVDSYYGAPQISVSYDLDFFGRFSSAAASARASLLASQDARDSIALAVTSSTAAAYISLLGFDARLKVTQATLAARVEALRIARRRADAGYTTRLELRQAESEYEATQQLVPAAELAVSREENALSVLLGDPPQEIARGVEFIALKAPMIPAGMPSSLLARRPDLAAARATLKASELSLDSARAAELPDFSLTASGGAALSTALPQQIALYSVGLNILSPLLDSGRLHAQAQAVAARRNLAAFAYRKAVVGALRDVEDGLISIKKLQEQQVAIDAQVATLRETLRLATNRYNDGYAPYLDQLDAERGLFGAQLVAIQIATDRLNALVGLYQALGGGWEPAPTEPHPVLDAR